MEVLITRTMLYISIVCTMFAAVNGDTRKNSDVTEIAMADTVREKRSLVYTYAPLVLLSCAVQVPFNIPMRPLQIAWGFQISYHLPINSTELSPGVVRIRRDVTMATSFLELEELLESYGFKGKQCVLRSICELAESPFTWENSGVLEEVIHALLTPSASVTSPERFAHQPYQEHVLQETRFLAAEHKGLLGADCVLEYPDCEKTPLELMTEKFGVF